jgi:hypothetical protein
MELSTPSVLIALQGSRFSHAIAKANHLLIAGLQIVHVFGLILLLGPLILIALRVLGLVLREQPLEDIIGQCRVLSAIGLILSLTSGVLMFTSAPLHYYANWAFDAKMTVLLAALAVYALIFAWQPAHMRLHATLARLHVVVAVVLWILVCMAGRAIGFV